MSCLYFVLSVVCLLLFVFCFCSPQSSLAKRKFLQSAVSAPANFLAFGLALALAFWLLCFPTSVAAASADIFACCLFLLRALWLCFVLRVWFCVSCYVCVLRVLAAAVEACCACCGGISAAKPDNPSSVPNSGPNLAIISTCIFKTALLYDSTLNDFHLYVFENPSETFEQLSVLTPLRPCQGDRPAPPRRGPPGRNEVAA